MVKSWLEMLRGHGCLGTYKNQFSFKDDKGNWHNLPFKPVPDVIVEKQGYTVAEIELAIKESRGYWRENQANVLDELRKHSINWPKDKSSVTSDWLGGDLGDIPREHINIQKLPWKLNAAKEELPEAPTYREIAGATATAFYEKVKKMLAADQPGNSQGPSSEQSRCHTRWCEMFRKPAIEVAADDAAKRLRHAEQEAASEARKAKEEARREKARQVTREWRAARASTAPPPKLAKPRSKKPKARARGRSPSPRPARGRGKRARKP